MMNCKKCGNQIPDGSIFCNWCGVKQLRERKKSGDGLKVPKPQQMSSGNWFIRLRMDGENINITEATERECIDKARAIKAGLIEHKKLRCGPTLSEAIDKYVDHRRAVVSPSTVATYAKYKRLYFQSLMQSDIASITVTMLQKEITRMQSKPGAKGKPLSAKTIKDATLFIISVLKFHKISLPYDDILLPQVQASPFGVLTQDQISTLLRALPGNPCQLQILLALWLGLRRSEIVALEKSDFDFERKTVSIRRAMVKDENSELVVKGTKTALSARVITCPDYILDLVRDMPDGLLYQYDINYILKCLHRVCEENGLPAIRLHDLRHINASVGLLLGVPDKYVMERGGWAQKDTMVYRYEHTYSDEKISADEAYNTFFLDRLNGKTSSKTASGE